MTECLKEQEEGGVEEMRKELNSLQEVSLQYTQLQVRVRIRQKLKCSLSSCLLRVLTPIFINIAMFSVLTYGCLTGILVQFLYCKFSIIADIVSVGRCDIIFTVLILLLSISRILVFMVSLLI